MTTDEILAKVSSGELSGEELSAAITALEPADVISLKSKIAEAAKEEYGKVSAFRQEKQRLETLVTDKKTELEKLATPPTPAPVVTPAPANDGMKQFRDEQVQKAATKFKSDFGLSEDEMKAINDTFVKLDTGKIDADNIYQEFVGAYAVVNKDKLVEAQRERTQREAAAAQNAAAAAAGAAGQAPTNGNQPPKYAENVTALAKSAGITEEAAKRLVEQGTKRVYG